MALYTTVLLHPVVVQGGDVGYRVGEIKKKLGYELGDLSDRYGCIVYDICGFDADEHDNKPNPGVPCLILDDGHFDTRLINPESLTDETIVDARFINTCVVLISHGCERVVIGDAYETVPPIEDGAIWFKGAWHKLDGVDFEGKKIDISKSLPY
jgi:hypothetical protein